MIAAIFASTTAGGIGLGGSLPWAKQGKNLEDLAWFRSHTKNNIVVMGRKTWEDPMMPKPLPDRINYVVSSRNIFSQYGSQVKWIPNNVCENIQNLSKSNPNKKIFVIGGQQLYESTIDLVDIIYWTRIKTNFRYDVKLSIDKILQNFRLMSVKPGNDCTYEIWERKS